MSRVSLTLHVDGERWRTHLRAMVAAHPGLVPVAKGNGYGFGNGRLARRAEWLGVDTVAVGTPFEIDDVAPRCGADILVLTPWRPGSPVDLANPRVIHTVSRADDLVALAATGHRVRVVLERATSMLRHGMDARTLRAAAEFATKAASLHLEGVALHLPLALHGHLDEVGQLMHDVVSAGLGGTTVWVSHLSDSELRTLATQWPGHTFRPRIGTSLWLGVRDALQVRATVLDAHRVRRGEAYGYRGRKAPRHGHILVVSGGTAHGIGLEAPTGDLGLRSRASRLARGGMDAAGLVRSPYFLSGRQLLFAEPPHMQASMLFLPGSGAVPDIGDEVDVRCRFTTTGFDRVLID